VAKLAGKTAYTGRHRAERGGRHVSLCRPVGGAGVDYARHVGRLGAVAVALGVGMAVVTTPGVVWADETGEDTSSVDSGPANPDPSPAPEGGGASTIDAGEPGETTTTTTTEGTETTTVIGGDGTPEVIISGSAVDTSGTTTEQTPEANTPTPTAQHFRRDWWWPDRLIPTAEPNYAPGSGGYTSSAPSPTSNPAPALAALAADASHPHPSTAQNGGPTGTLMLTTLADIIDGGAGQIGLRMTGRAGPDDSQALTVANFANDATTVDVPAAALANSAKALWDKALWVIPGRSTADMMYAVTGVFAAILLAACAFASARSRVIRRPSGVWRAEGSPFGQMATTVFRFPPLSRLLR
jgi:hypothetical protein